jgi:alanine racemase
MNRGVIAEIDLDNLSVNLQTIKDISGGCSIIAVVKANAYGHGAVEISKRLVKEGVQYLAVAFTKEAQELRESGIDAEIIVLFDSDIEDIFSLNLIPVISDVKTAAALSKEAVKRGCAINVHVKVDTGMGRLGITGDAVQDILEIANLSGIHIYGIMSHFSDADVADTSFSKKQCERLRSLKAELLNKGLKVSMFHMANSAALMSLPESHFDAVRPGLMLYGYSPITAVTSNKDSNKLQVTSNIKGSNESIVTNNKCNSLNKLVTAVKNSSLVTCLSLLPLKPVMTVKAKILALRKLPAGAPISYGRTFITKRDSLIGVIAAGYADGFSRRFSNNADILVRGKRVPVVGRVCMDLTMIDLTGIEHVEEGDDAVIIGKQGSDFIGADELALRADTIAYEILTSLGNKSKMKYNSHE